MTGIQAFIAISIVLVALVTYSALAVSSKQEQRMIQRVKADNKLREHYHSLSMYESFEFETSAELEPEKDDDFDDLKNI